MVRRKKELGIGIRNLVLGIETLAVKKFLNYIAQYLNAKSAENPQRFAKIFSNSLFDFLAILCVLCV